MDRPSDLLTTLVARARQMDETALAALANKGLLRRAQKDLEKATPKLAADQAAEQSDAVQLLVDGNTVSLRAVPTDSTCTCPASGVCRHQLAAWMFLAGLEASVEPGASKQLEASADSGGRPAEAVTAEDPTEALLTLDDGDLERFGGRPLLRRALAELGAGVEVVVDPEHPGHLMIPALGVELRFFSGEDPLATSVCSCHEAPACVHRVIAVCGLQAAAGKRQLKVDEPDLAASTQAPRTRSSVLEAARSLLFELVATGLTRVSPSTLARLHTLSTSAHGVDLPRLERELGALAGSLEDLRERTGGADSRDAALRAARLLALVDGLERGVTGLVGRHRSRFVRVGELELLGVGAEAFTTARGHRGLTCWFWDVAGQAWNSWTDARSPASQRGFDPAARFVGPGPWEGCASPRAAVASRVRLLGGYRSVEGRLSARQSVRAVLDDARDLASVPAVSSWEDLERRAQQLFGGGLRSVALDTATVLVAPREVGELEFDPITPRWVCELVDQDGRRIAAEIERAALGVDGEAALRAAAEGAWGLLLARVTLLGSTVALRPITLLGNAQPLHLTLEAAEVGPTAPAASAADEVSGAEEQSFFLEASDPVSSQLDELLFELVEHSERGARTPVRERATRQIDTVLDGLGFGALRVPLRSLPDAGDPMARAAALLRALHAVDRAQRAWMLRAAP